MYILVVDCETTGIDPTKNGIIEVSTGLYDEYGNLISEYNLKQGTTKTVNLGALKVNKTKISTLLDRMRNQKHTFSDNMFTFPGLIDYLLDLPEDTILCGHNVDFDVKFIKAELESLGMENVGAILPYKKVDTKVLGQTLVHSGIIKDNHTSLHKIADCLGIEYDKERLHGAVYDRELTAKVYFDIVKRMEALTV